VSTEEREPQVELPEDAVEDLEVDAEDAEGVAGGTTNQQKTIDKTMNNWSGYIRG
jgi:hypothetical protein